MQVPSFYCCQVLELLVGKELLKTTQLIYDNTGQEPVLCKRPEKIDYIFHIAAPSVDEVLELIPHSIKDREACLNITKYLACWRVFYQTNTGSPSREMRMSPAFTNNNLAECLVKLWINTTTIDMVMYKFETQTRINLVHFLYPKHQSLSLISDETVSFFNGNDLLTMSIYELAKTVKHNFEIGDTL